MPPASTPFCEEASSGRPAVLLAHAHAEMRRFLREELSRRYHILLAAHARKAWQKVMGKEPDLLVADAALPALGGRALCRKVKEASVVEECRVLLLAEEEAGAPKAGASKADASETDVMEKARPEALRPAEVLTKPFDAGTLRRRVQRLLVGGAGGRGRLVEAVLRLIDERLGEPDLTTEDIAEAVGLSRRHLNRQVKAATGHTPATLLRRRRMEVAKRRLQAGGRTVAEVAKAVGFRSPSHFSQAFRKQVGCTPSAYAERQKET